MEVALYGEVFDVDITEGVTINPADLYEELVMLPDKLAEYIILSEAVSKEAALAKHEYKKIYARLDCAERERATLLSKAGDKIKLTEKMVENYAITQPAYDKAYKHYLELQEKADVLRSVVSALFAKKDIVLVLFKAKSRVDGARENDSQGMEDALLQAKLKAEREKRREQEEEE